MKYVWVGKEQTELRSCVKVEVDVLGSPIPNKPTVSVDVKQHFNLHGTVTDMPLEKMQMNTRDFRIVCTK